MVDEGDRFFGEDDPEWAVSQLAAQVAATAQVRRRVSWHIVFGSVLTTVLVVGAFVLGLNQDGSSDPQADPQPTGAGEPTGAGQPSPVELPRARRVTLAPKPEPVPTPTSTVTVLVTPTPQPEPEPVPDKPSTPSNQVGPNRPITTPIDPDDR